MERHEQRWKENGQAIFVNETSEARAADWYCNKMKLDARPWPRATSRVRADEIVIGVATGENMLFSRAAAVRDTWLLQFPLARFYAYDASALAFDVVSLRAHVPSALAARIDLARLSPAARNQWIHLFALKHMYESAPPTARYFYLLGDDNYVDAPRLLELLDEFDGDDGVQWMAHERWGPVPLLPTFALDAWPRVHNRSSVQYTTGAAGCVLKWRAAAAFARHLERFVAQLLDTDFAGYAGTTYARFADPRTCGCQSFYLGYLLSLCGFELHASAAWQRATLYLAVDGGAQAKLKAWWRKDDEPGIAVFHNVWPYRMYALSQLFAQRCLERHAATGDVVGALAFARTHIDAQYEALRRRQAETLALAARANVPTRAHDVRVPRFGAAVDGTMGSHDEWRRGERQRRAPPPPPPPPPTPRTVLVVSLFTRYTVASKAAAFLESAARVQAAGRVRLHIVFVDSESPPLRAPVLAQLAAMRAAPRVIGAAELASAAFAGLFDREPLLRRWRDTTLRVVGQRGVHAANMSAAAAPTMAALLDAWRVNIRPMQRRHLYYLLVLAHYALVNRTHIDAALLTDVVDVVLQDDPSRALEPFAFPATAPDSIEALLREPRRVAVSQEGCYSHWPSNRWWFKSCFGEDYPYETNRPPVCGGTLVANMAGALAHELFLLRMMCALAGTRNFCIEDQPLQSVAVRAYERGDACIREMRNRTICIINERKQQEGACFAPPDMCLADATGDDGDVPSVRIHTADDGQGLLVTLACLDENRRADALGSARFAWNELFELVDDDAERRALRYRDSKLFPALVHQYPRLKPVYDHMQKVYSKASRR